MKKIIVILSIVFVSFYILFNIFTINNNQEKYDITFASWGSQSEVEIITDALHKFEKEKKVKVNFLHIPQNYFQKIHLLFASNLEPDVIFINNQNIQMYINADLLEDLSPYFPQAKKDNFKESIDCFSQGNKLFAIPRDISNLLIYYNKDIFSKNNIIIPEKIENIIQLKELAQSVTTNENWGINYEEDSLFWIYYLASNGGGIISDDKKSIIINRKESIEALNLYSDFINKFHIAPTKSDIGSMTTAQMFINGKLAMYLGGRWMFPKFSETITFNWDIIEFPANENSKLYIDSSGWAISKKSKNKELAIELVRFLSSLETSNQFVKSGLIVPANMQSAKLFLKEDKRNKPFIQMLNYSKPTPTNENYSKINDILKEKVQFIFSGDIQAESAFDNKTIEKLESLL